MDDFKRQIAAEFDRHQSLLTDKDRRAFWVDVEKWANEMTPDQRLAAQTDVRENIEQILHRMEAIREQLTVTEKA